MFPLKKVKLQVSHVSWTAWLPTISSAFPKPDARAKTRKCALSVVHRELTLSLAAVAVENMWEGGRGGGRHCKTVAGTRDLVAAHIEGP